MGRTRQRRPAHRPRPGRALLRTTGGSCASAGTPRWATASDDDGEHLRPTDRCETATSAGDLLELTDGCRTLVLVGVPFPSSTGEDARRRSSWPTGRTTAG